MPEFSPTEEQRKILEHDMRRHARVKAGPGTGKSATLVALLDKLITEGATGRMKLLTFTRAATGELLKKVSSHPAAAAEHPSTIHSFAISILLANPGAGNFPEPLRIADDWEFNNVVRLTLAKRLGIKQKQLDRLVKELAANWEALRPQDDAGISDELRSRFLGAWNEHRLIFGYVLLQELPYALRHALVNYPELRGIDFDLLIVDEYQDLNSCDLDVIHLLSQRGCSIIGAGDDDQSIYHFRKAAPEGIRRFLTDYPGGEDYALSITQRCGSQIIEWANYVISGDPDRPQRNPLTPVAGSPRGECKLLSFRNQSEEIEGVAELIENLTEQDVKASDILVLLRSDYYGIFSRPLKGELKIRNIPCSEEDAVERMLQEPDNRRIMEVLRLVENEEDSIAWASLLKLSKRIGMSFFEYVYGIAKSRRATFGKTLLETYGFGFPGAPSASASKAKEFIRQTLNWLNTRRADLQEQEHWGASILELPDGLVIPQPSKEFQDLLLSLDEIADPGQNLGRYLSQVIPLGKDMMQATCEGVRIMSMGGAKGLTVRATIMMALEEGIVPRPEADLGEERRLLYVAMTRSKEFLYGTWARTRTGPTARSGEGQVGGIRNYTHFLQGGPVDSEDGKRYLATLI